MTGDVQHCMRCGRTAVRYDSGPPRGWEGTNTAGVCPNCQLAEWHPHCTSIVAFDEPDRALDLAAMPAAEIDTDMVRHCDHVDLTISVTDSDPDWPTEWVCPTCGGHEFEWVHADYPTAGLA